MGRPRYDWRPAVAAIAGAVLGYAAHARCVASPARQASADVTQPPPDSEANNPPRGEAIGSPDVAVEPTGAPPREARSALAPLTVSLIIYLASCLLWMPRDAKGWMPPHAETFWSIPLGDGYAFMAVAATLVIALSLQRSQSDRQRQHPEEYAL